MDVKIQSIHFDATERLQSFIQKKVSKLSKFYDDVARAEVSLRVVKPETATNKEASVKVIAPSGEFFAKKVCDTFEEAVDLCVDAIETQLIKHKEKLRSK
jgi:putative sigma-54 modulation protein